MARYIIREVNYQATFNGKHNQSKAKCLIVLYERYLSGKNGLSLSRLSELSGVGYNSLSAQLPNWTRWRYVNRRGTAGKFMYSISLKGRRWLNKWASVMPLDRYISEIEGHEAK